MKKIIKVTWRDSHRYMYQMNIEDEVEVTEIETVGWLVRKQDGDLVLAQDIINDDIRGVIVIPHECVVKVQRLEVPDPIMDILRTEKDKL